MTAAERARPDRLASRLFAGPAGRLAAYAFITATAAAGTFLTTPLLVRILGVGAFGSWSLLEPLAVTLAGAALLGADHGVLKRIALDGIEMGTAIGSVLPFVFVSLLLAGIIAGGLASPLSQQTVSPLAFGLLIVFEGAVVFFALSFRGATRLVLYGVSQVGRTALNLAAIACLMLVWRDTSVSLAAVVAVRLAAAGVIALGLLLWVRPRLRPNWPVYKDAVGYGVFIAVTSALAAFGDNFDRYVVGSYMGADSVGRYVVSVKIAAIVNQGLVLPLMVWFPAERFRHLNDPDGGSRFFRLTATVILALLVLASGSVYLLGGTLTELMAPGCEYSAPVLALLLTAGIATAMAHPFNIGLLKPGRSHLNIVPIVAAGAIGYWVARIAVPAGGLAGAAVGKTVCSFCVAALCFVLSQRFHPVTFGVKRLFVLFALPATTLFVLSLPQFGGMSVWLKGTCFVAFLVSIFVWAVREEVAPAMRLVWPGRCPAVVPGDQ